jgi:hypothetical protein
LSLRYLLVYLEGISLEESELEAQIQSELSRGPEFAQLIPLVAEAIERVLNRGHGATRVHFHGGSVRPENVSFYYYVL